MKVFAPAAVLAIGGMLIGNSTYAKTEYTKKEKKSCTFCHVKPASKELNDAGRYYQEHKNSLEGYTPPAK